MNNFFESLSAEQRYGESVKNDKNSLLPPFPGQASTIPMGFTKATRMLYNLATNTFGVIVENQPAVRFYCAKTAQLKRVVSPVETNENLEEVLWSEDGLYFAATIANALNLWPLFETHPPKDEESLEDEISRERQFFQIKFPSKIAAIAPRLNMTGKNLASNCSIVACIDGAIVECSLHSGVFRVVRRFPTNLDAAILALQVNDSHIFVQTENKISAFNITSGL